MMSFCVISRAIFIVRCLLIGWLSRLEVTGKRMFIRQ